MTGPIGIDLLNSSSLQHLFELTMFSSWLWILSHSIHQENDDSMTHLVLYMCEET